MTYQRQIVDLDGRTLRQESATEEIFIRPGMKRGTVFHLKGRGNEMARRTPTDLYVKIERPESSANAFQRINEFDLVYVHKISLADVLRCCPINLTTFDGRKLLIPISGINPGYAMKVEREGMPIYEGLDLDGQ